MASSHTRSTVREFFLAIALQSRIPYVTEQVSPPKMVMERKMLEVKQHAEAVSTQRHEMKVPLTQHRRFSETVAIDHRARPQEMQVCHDF